MISYFKTQWFTILIGLINIGFSIYNCIQDNELMAGAWMLSAILWLIMSRVDFNAERIKLLEKKQERDDAMYELVQELIEANKIDREIDKAQDQRIKQLEEKLR